MTQEEFIEKAKVIHGNKYDYSKVVYINTTTKICIICPIHGEFYQTPKNHLKGWGCRKCGRQVCASKLSGKDQFIEKAKSIHKNKYDYSKVKYVNALTKVCIICPEHGEFWQDPHAHLKGCGCTQCGNKKRNDSNRRSLEEFINKAKEIHWDKYDYSKSEYVNDRTKICIICPEHGEFWQTPNAHLSGQGCKECGYINNSKKHSLSLDDFVKKSTIIHRNKYNYSKSVYSSSEEQICIICPKHGEFWQRAQDHLQGHGCPKCANRLSKAENEIYEYACKLVGKENVIHNDRQEIYPKEIDVYIPSLCAGIEYHGLIWHSKIARKDKNYHLDKLKECQKKGIKLIQIFEDEYISHKDIVLSKIAHILGKCENLPKIMARKCVIREISIEESKDFLDKNHIQGYGGGKVHLGAFYEDILIGVMVFRAERNNKWELTRFASDNSYICCGIGGKLFHYFVRNYNPNEIKSFADRRWTVDEENNVYTKLGFVFDSYTSPDYRYYRPQDGLLRQHKFGFRKERLHKKYGLPISMTESEMTDKLGYSRIYDCGLIKYVWKKRD